MSSTLEYLEILTPAEDIENMPVGVNVLVRLLNGMVTGAIKDADGHIEPVGVVPEAGFMMYFDAPPVSWFHIPV